MKIGVAAAACLIASLVQVQAEDMQFHINNKTTYNIQVRFFSQTRAAWWPGEKSGWDMNVNASNDFKLSCNPGEKVCYGAWTMPKPTLDWGVGLDGKNKCSACCYSCGANSNEINLDK
jgi:hypothetical protein